MSGEEAWVETLRQRFPFSRGVGIGDDAAVVTPGSRDRSSVVTTDLLVEGVHFRVDDLSPQQLARKSLAVNLSDLAAMGARPLFYTLALVLSPERHGQYLDAFYDGLEAANADWNVELAGGDFSTGGLMTIAITAVGEARRAVMRGGAQEGDLVAVCGKLGWSRLGLLQLLSGQRGGAYVDAHIDVKPLIREGLILADHVHAMMDVSDGLLKDLKRICVASSLGAELDVDALPMDRDFARVCKANGLDPLETVLCGGEDYALLFTLSEAALGEIRRVHPELPIGEIGRIVSAPPVVRIIQKGQELKVPCRGYDHFEPDKG